jgi:ATP-binding cassette subfamily F protein 3
MGQSGVAPTRIAELGKRLKSIGDEVETAESRWLDLTTQIDTMTAAGS